MNISVHYLHWSYTLYKDGPDIHINGVHNENI
jgi:hypothetical protein